MLSKLETKHLTLRKINRQDIEDIFYYGSNPNVSKRVSWETHKSKEDTERFIDAVLEGYSQNNKALWGMELKSTGKIIGTIDFVTINHKHNNAELGYVLSEDYWGNGLTTEATQKIVEVGFTELGLVRIQARCFVENIGSQRVMEKVGMSFEGLIRKGMFAKGEYQDLKLYSIFAEEFQG
ncbi:GNAT family N-acetyltransferase [Bacillus sp. BHET2]|uniref:GNAT family N-acetyltransferase n=1 Tax=Bacillus sp. BHET2 TaxID=2583818 RepID=UPI00110EADB4|nr:GNAT family protein [Bacillus sp. BHET2]TMU83635.1 GNAT family N-acetyltransferase [Bacillus sp. BHET2]